MFIWHDRRDYLHVIFSFHLTIIDRNGSNRLRSTYGGVSEKDMVYSDRDDKMRQPRNPSQTSAVGMIQAEPFVRKRQCPF